MSRQLATHDLISYRSEYVPYVSRTTYCDTNMSKNRSNQIKSNQIKSNQIESNRIESNRINHITSHHITSNQIKSNQINHIELNGRIERAHKICFGHMDPFQEIKYPIPHGDCWYNRVESGKRSLTEDRSQGLRDTR